MLKTALKIMGRKRWGRLCALVVAMFLGALLEMLGISLIGAVCSLLVNSARAMDNPAIAAIARWTGIQPGRPFAVAMLLLLGGVYLFKMAYLLLENYAVARFIRTMQHEVSTELYDGLLRGPYSYFKKTSTMSIISMMETDMWRMSTFMSAMMQTMAEGLVLLAVSILLVMLNYVMTLFVLAGLAAAFLVSRGLSRWKIYGSGREEKRANMRRLKWLHQGIRGIKDVKISQREDFFSARYAENDGEMCKATRAIQFLSKAPNQTTEAIMAVAMLLYILLLVETHQDITAYISSLAALVLAAVRLLPSCSRINSSLNQMSAMRPSMESVARGLKQVEDQRAERPRPAGREVELRRSITARAVTFRYEDSPEPVLENVDVEIPIGASVGIVGPSGAGKTTLVDVLLGLLRPQQGTVCADGVEISDCLDSYLRQIAYIPQDIFLLDDTVRSNVVFGMPAQTISDGDIWDALEQASLGEMVRKLPKGLDTFVGENGIRLSGGERQRLGIARALYQKCQVMIFDEATSALDPETEEAVIGSIRRLKGARTMVVISHRHSAVAACDRLYRVEGSHVVLADRPGGDER